MPTLSPLREAWPVLDGLKLLSRGKVRDSYELPNGKRLVVATDGISALDYVLNAVIPMKGIVLNSMTVFWLKMLERHGVNHHMIAFGAGIDQYLPEELRGNIDLQSRAMVVENLSMFKAEFVIRGHLTGSAVKPYQETGIVCGHKLPLGLQDGDELTPTLFTPTTKEEEGHDKPVPAEEIIRIHPLASRLAVEIFKIAYEYAKERGIIIADTKFEFGDRTDLETILGDEVLTPDSSRFWPYDEWIEGRKPETGRKAPSSFDKEPIRRWLKQEIAKWLKDHSGVEKMDPEIREHVDAVQSLVIPPHLIKQTTQGYKYIFWRLVGQNINDFRREVLGINLPKEFPKTALVVCGSETDLPLVQDICSLCNENSLHITIDIMSCHRNPQEVMEMARVARPDLVICAGGKAFALPGVFDAWAHYFGNDVPVAGVALGEDGSKSLEAAILSIDEIPGQPVIMDEITGNPYIGGEGLESLLKRLINGEFPPQKSRKKKPYRRAVWQNF